jgi:hypothetical protein
LIPASEWEPAPSGNARTLPTQVALVGALDSVGTDLRRATASPAPAEAGGAPDGAGGRMAGETAGARSERRGWGMRRAGARREQRKCGGDGHYGKCRVERAVSRTAL